MSEMHIYLDKKSSKALYIQLYEALSKDIASGKLRRGVKLPSRRALSEQLNISQNTVDGAYRMLMDTGYVTSIPRQGYIVSFKAPNYDSNAPWEINAPETVVFSPNGIDVSRINRAAYAKILRNIAYNDGMDILSYTDKSGEFELRSAVSEYLYSFRGVKCSPDQIIIGAGAEYLLVTLLALFSKDTRLIMENPCETHFYRVLSDYNYSPLTLPLNIGRFNMDALYSSEGNILFIDPDSRFPRSEALSDIERRDILSWAERCEGRYIIENCCDSEIQWKASNSMHSMDTIGRVIYLGSFSRSFCPAVKTSYMVLPPELLARWKQGHAFYYALTPKLEQFALAEFINKGYFTKHYKNMRRVYMEKRVFLTECFTDIFDGKFLPLSDSGSTYITAELEHITTEEIKKTARRAGVKLFSMNSYNVSKITEPIANDKLVIGFGDLTREKIKLGARLILG